MAPRILSTSPANRWRWLLGAIVLAAGLALIRWVHPFLALTAPVPADILVVEGWVPDNVVAAARQEFARGAYRRMLVSGLKYAPDDPRFHGEESDALQIAGKLVAAGFDQSKLEICPAPPTSWNRTSTMARTVRDRLRVTAAPVQGVNVITLGPHARQSRLAYQRMLGPGIPVGVISIPKDNYDPDWWWVSTAGIAKTTKDFAGWIKEVLFGYRS